MNTNKYAHEFEDIFFAAFLEYCGHKVMLCKQPEERVLFEVIGDIAGDVQAFYRNKEVGVLEYCRIVNDLERQKENLRK